MAETREDCGGHLHDHYCTELADEGCPICDPQPKRRRKKGGTGKQKERDDG